MTTGNIKTHEIKQLQVKYHRNGTQQEGFFLCSFQWKTGKETLALQAVVNDSFIAVINPADINQRFDGGDFSQALREHLHAVETDAIVYSR